MSKLRRSRYNKVIAGVCGGIGEYLNIDPVIIRVAWVILTFVPGSPGLLAYLICMLIIPEDNGVIYENDNNSSYNSGNNLPTFIGIALIILGAFLLLNILFPRFFHMFNMFNIIRYWPVLLIILGIYIIVKQKNK